MADRRDFSETRLLLKFLNRLIDADRENLLYELVWNRYPTSIRLMMENAQGVWGEACYPVVE